MIFSCGKANRVADTHIAGGTVTDVNEYPWQVRLQFICQNINF